MMETRQKDRKEQRKPLRAVVADLDQEILRLLTRRHNLLSKMRKNGRIPVADEKFLRESWQNDVARVSRDPDLSGRFFALMNQLSFLPRPQENMDSEAPKQRTAFNLAPPLLSAQIELTVPLDENQTRAWLYLACRSGQEIHLAPCLQSDALVDFVKGLAQLEGAVTRSGDSIFTRPGPVLSAPDKTIFAGDSHFNFYIFIAHYLGTHGRVRLSGAHDLELEDFSAIRQAVSQLGARMVHIIPHSSGLPVRLETSGILPPGLVANAQLPAGFIESLLLCAPFYESPFAVDLAPHPCAETIMAHILPILEVAGVTFAIDNKTISVNPSPVSIPAKPLVPMATELALFIMALTSALGGSASLHGIWPGWPEATQVQIACADAHWQWEQDKICTKNAKPLASFVPGRSPLPTVPWHKALWCTLAVCACLHNGSGSIWPEMVEDGDVLDFLRITGCAVDDSGQLTKMDKPAGRAWNAPSPAWALALAVAAGARPEPQGWPLGNPGIVTALWPLFWNFYNKLPKAEIGETRSEPVEQPKKRRRIFTNATAKLPEPREENWD